MSPDLLIAFIAACVVLALTPGPAMSLIIANTTSHCLAAGLWSVAGNALGFSLLVAGAGLGMTSVMVLMSEWFDIIRWAGALYLVWLGIAKLRQAMKGANAGTVATNGKSRSWFLQGIAVALSNPKVMLFIGAFLPQFIDAAAPPGPQLALLAVLFVVTLTVVDALYAALVAHVRGRLRPLHQRVMEGATGGLLIAGGVWLALARRA